MVFWITSRMKAKREQVNEEMVVIKTVCKQLRKRSIEPKHKEILAADITKEQNMFVVERFLSHVVNKYGLHSVSSDGGTWYPQACKLLKLVHHFHSSYEKSLIERTMQYIKNRTESFDDYFPCKKNKCKLNHIKQWVNSYVKKIVYASVN